ncbi:MAG: hypothetical protein V9E81_02445 [Marmoricola sp.]
MTTFAPEPDLGTPAVTASSEVTLSIDGQDVTVPVQHLGDACGCNRRH